MKVSAFERILKTDRIRPQTAERAKAGFARPVLCEREVDPGEAPFLVTNMRGSFLPTRRSSEGTARFAFSECPITSEDALLNELYRVLWELSERHGWVNRCTSISEAKTRMEAMGIEPKAIIVGPSFLDGVEEEDANRLMLVQGYIAQVDGLYALAASLLPGRAILSSVPADTGDYVRSGDHLGLLICRADRSLFLVGEE